MLEQNRRAVVRDSLGVGLAVGAYGVAFGAVSVAAGLSVLETSLLSLLAFTGGTQFAVVSVVSGGGTLATALGGGLLLGARNTLYAMRLAAPVAGARPAAVRGGTGHDR
jgi:branched chain amino acid efflux pump